MSTSVDLERAPWLAAGDRKLAHEIRDLLLRMLMVSEGRVQVYEVRTSGGEGDGVLVCDSLHDFFRAEFARARDDLHRRVILCRGRVALREHTHGISPLRTAGHVHSLSSEVERAQREQAEALLKDGEGVHAAEIAAETGWPIGWVRTIRERAGRDPDYGHERPKFRELSEDERRRLIESYKADGLDQRTIGRELGVSQATVSRYWPRAIARAA